MATAGPGGNLPKRKKVVLTIEEKLEILGELKKGVSYTSISEKYGIGRSTVADIKKNESKLREYKERKTTFGFKKVQAKVMKSGSYELLDAALYIWFRQQREKNLPVSGALLKEKALLLFAQLYPDSPKEFHGSTGYQWRFCKRFGIKYISVECEQVSADLISACDFQFQFASIIQDYTHDQVFNCDETGLQFRLLPRKTLASVFERRAEGRKKSKDRITLNACANVTGSIKLPLLFIGKAARPRCFKGTNLANLPVIYKNQKNAWVNTRIFTSWFHDYFVPHIQKELLSMGQEPTALLLLDNCSAHPDEEELVSSDGKVKALFLPPNVTSLIQPMDQGVLESLKRRYRKSLLRDILIASTEELDIAKYLKSITMKVVVEKVAMAWDEISASTIRRSWQKLIPIFDDQDASSSSVIPSNSETSPDRPSNSEFVGFFSRLGQSLTEVDIDEWLEADANDQGYEHLDDAGIVEHVLSEAEIACSEADDGNDSESDAEQEEVIECISHSTALDMFDKCLAWVHCQQEATSFHTSTLLSLKELAARKRFSSLKQTSLTSFWDTN